MSSTSRGGKRHISDFYETRSWVVHRFLEAVDLPGGCWIEPMAGEGSIIRAVQERRSDVGFRAIEKRLRCRENLVKIVGSEQLVTTNDFFKVEPPDREHLYDVSITNPAFSVAMDAILHSLKFAHHVVHLLRLNFLGTEDRNEFFRECMPDIYVIPDRVSFAKSITCTRSKKVCGYAKIVSLATRVPKLCRCGAKLRVSTTDSIEYCWMHWGPERERSSGKIEVLAHTPLEERKLFQ